MAFSLSPAVTVREIDNSQYISNLPSSKTGIVLRANTGPCNKITQITNESELVKLFGKPTAYNYQDWFQAWNFLQYANSLYVVRPMEATVKNAGVALTGETYSTGSDQENLYNTEVAFLTLQDDTVGASDRLHFYNRYVTSNQDIGVAVCSSKEYWNSPIASEFTGVVTMDGSSQATMNKLGGLSSDTVASTVITLNSNTLKAGSKFLSNSNKLYTVKTASDTSIVLNAGILPKDIAKFTGKIKTGETVADVSNGILFEGTEVFKMEKNTIIELSTGKFFYVTSISDSNGDKLVKFQFVPSGGASSNLSVTVTATYKYSNSVYKFMNLSEDYHPAGSDYTVPIGTSVIKVNSGFNYPTGSQLLLSVSSGNYVGVIADAYTPEEIDPDNTVDTYEIIGSDSVNNTITLDTALTKPIVLSNGSTGLIDDIDILPVSINGINLFSTVYDDSLIRKNKVTVQDAETLKNQTITIESLPAFSNYFEYEPDWVADQFVTIVLKLNNENKYEIVERKLASYSPTGRDSQNKNIFANEVFYYNSSYVYCKVTEDETMNKANTCTGGIVKFESNTAVLDGSFNFVAYGTVYPLKENNNAVVIDAVTHKATYDPNNYSMADIQNAQELYSDAESFDVNILITHELDANGMAEIAETRKDCFNIVAPYDYRAIVGQGSTGATTYLLEKFGTQTTSEDKIFTYNGTYSGIYGNMKYQYDRYNDVNRWICIAGDIAGLMAATDLAKDPWWASAGLDRGKIKNVIKLAFNANKQNRDDLYVNAINPIVTITGEGMGIVMGNKTATAKSSALDRVNVRRLLIYIEKAIASAIKYCLFEFNDSYTRTKVDGLIRPFLRTVKARRGLYWFDVKCDEENNTPAIIDQNAMVIDIAVQPSKTAEAIQLNVSINNTGETTFAEG